MYFDTHAHYDDAQFDGDRDALLSEVYRAGVTCIVDPGDRIASSRKAIAIAEQYDFIYAAVGIHPENVGEAKDAELDELRKMAAYPKVVAIGEIGLDYHYGDSRRELQQEWFVRQLELARELKLPAVVHERDATEDALKIVSRFSDVRGVFHCFGGSWETAEALLDQGWYLSFTGAVTFKNARKAPEVIRKMPADRIMIETDSPYLAPVPNRGQRNSSLNLPYIAAKIAELRGITTEAVAALTKENGLRFFKITSPEA